MLFTEPSFLFYFLPGTLAAYHLIPQRWRNLVLTCASLLFYAVGEASFLGWLLGSTAATYLVARGIDAWRGQRRARLLLALGITIDLALLGYFKYASFAVRTGVELGLLHAAVPSIILPLGISFFTFHKISYKVDVHRGTAVVRKDPLDLLLYILFFPQLIAGPIIRYHDVAAELVRRKVLISDFATGIRRFAIGLAKKMLVANTVGAVADQVFGLKDTHLGTLAAWIGLACYTIQIYFDFSGYSDMAIGLARMFGFHFLENFDHPYTSRSITEFWRRWHISLSRWFRDYLYIPLGGNRGPAWRTYLNLSVVFALCGLWHGASWNFVLWGLFHGSLLIAERAGWASTLSRLPRLAQHAQTVLWVMLGWVLFRCTSMAHALAYLRALAGGGASVDPFELFHTLTPNVWIALVVGAVGSAPVLTWARRRFSWAEAGAGRLAWGRDGVVVALLLAAGLEVASGTYNPFIYFRF
jgi:alginate O-acetyltransferase complex protein AlgI